MKSSVAWLNCNDKGVIIKTASGTNRGACLTSNAMNGGGAKKRRCARGKPSSGGEKMIVSGSGANTSDGYRSKGG